VGDRRLRSAVGIHGVDLFASGGPGRQGNPHRAARCAEGNVAVEPAALRTAQDAPRDLIALPARGPLDDGRCFANVRDARRCPNVENPQSLLRG
jgi:hypothetical protein